MSSDGDQTPAGPVKHSPLGGLVWKLLSIAATILATRLATTLAQRGWRIATGKPVPVKGDYEHERTGDVVAFTALSGMLVAGARIAAERKAAEYYRQSTGHLPKALETKLSKAERKAEAAQDTTLEAAQKRVDRARQNLEQTSP